MSIADELLDEIVTGPRPSYAQLVTAVLDLQPRQAEAMCLRLWALTPLMVAAMVRGGLVEQLARREGYSMRATARAMAIDHKAVASLIERAKPNIAAWLLASSVPQNRGS